MANLDKKRETITIGPPVRCARHGITLPGHVKTNVITLENMFQPSNLTEVQIWLVYGYLRLGMPEKKKRCNTNWRDDIVRFSGNELWKRVPKQEFIVKSRREWGGGWWTQRHSIEISKDGFPWLSEQGDNPFQIKCYSEVCSRKTYKIKHWLKGVPEIWVGLHDQRQNGDSIINSPRMNGRPLTSKQ